MSKHWPKMLQKLTSVSDLLEKDLESLYIQQYISGSEYKTRKEKLSFLKNEITNIRAKANQFFGYLISDQTPFIFEFVESRTEDEKSEIIKHLKNQNYVYQTIFKLNQKVIRLAKKISIQGIGFFQFFSFSKLKSHIDSASLIQQNILELKRKNRIPQNHDLKKIFFEVELLKQECLGLKEALLIRGRGFHRDKKDFFSSRPGPL